MIRSCSVSQNISRERRTLFHKLCHRSKTKDCVWAMHRLVQLSVQDWLSEGQENRRVATMRVRVCGVELSPMQRSFEHELRGYFRIISGYGLYSMYPYLHQSVRNG